MLTTSDQRMNEPVLIAGAGDVGGRLAALLAGQGHTVYALRRGEAISTGNGVRWLRGDLTRPDTLRDLPAVKRVVFAATPDARYEAAYRAVFVDGFRHLLDALAPASLERAVFVSSSAVYGEHDGAWVDEDTPPDPPGFNGHVLLEAERWLATRDVAGIAVRLAGLYGPGRMQLFQNLRDGSARVPRGGHVFANRIHVDDAAAALAHVLALDDPAPVYLGVDDMPLPMDVLYDHIAGLLGVPPPEEGPGPRGIGNKRLSNARLRASGFRCRWPDARVGYTGLLGE
ncbi:NAD-dependent epimerase/dehydratase family protein [Luteibacter rhizovicinus]